MSKNHLLPSGWSNSNLGDLLVLNYGKALPDRVRSGKGVPVYGSNGVVGFHHEPLTNGTTIIIGRKGSVGEINYSDGACSPIDTTYYIDKFPGDVPRYWYYQLKTMNLGSLNKATAIPGLNREDAYNQDVVIAPLNEQKRIADKLDAVLARVDACRDRLDRITAILKRFRQSVLTAAISGQLTEEWRESQGECDEWNKASLESLIADGPKNGLYKASTSYGQGTRILRIDNFYAGFIESWETLKRLTVDASELDDFGLRVGDIVVNRVNSMSHLGKSALVRDLPEPCVFESNMMRIRLDRGQILPEFGILVLTSPEGIAQLQQNAKQAVNQASINQGDVKAVVVELPSISEQTEIVRRVESLFAYADRLEARYNTARTQVEKLTPALLAKAFRGELVPQDPADEPASELLAKIKTQREADKPTKKPKATKV